MSRPEPVIVDDLSAALTVKQTARLWSCSVDAIYEAIARGDCPVPVLRIGRVIRLSRASVLGAIGLNDGEPGCSCQRADD
jgi:predicted DNA-binding transcriptional regulator AlpA